MQEITDTARASKVNDEVILSWSTHLAARQPVKLAILLPVIVFASVTGYFAIGVLGAVAAAFLIISSTADFLFPIRFELTRDRAICYMLLKRAEIRWSNVKRCYVDEFGLKLSPLGVTSRREAFRGVYLRFNGNSRQVIEAVESLRVK